MENFILSHPIITTIIGIIAILCFCASMMYVVAKSLVNEDKQRIEDLRTYELKMIEKKAAEEKRRQEEYYIQKLKFYKDEDEKAKVICSRQRGRSKSIQNYNLYHVSYDSVSHDIRNFSFSDYVDNIMSTYN